MDNETIQQAIEKTASKFAVAINESGLDLSIIRLLLTNIIYQLDLRAAQAQTISDQEDTENAKSES